MNEITEAIDLKYADTKSATLKMKLKSQSGYNCTQESEVSPNQWRDIQLVIEGKLKSNN